MTLEITINHNRFILHHSGAMYWEEQGMLLISDVHLGKVSHFRKYGAAIPNSAKYKNFQKLDEVVQYFNPEKICFLGDLFHSTLNTEWELFEEWVQRTQKPIVLVAGNHDIIPVEKFEALEITICSEWLLNGFLLVHHPEERKDFFTLSGHIHPAVQLQGVGRQRMKLPCFFRSEKQMILPAFGAFTGTYVMQPQEGDVAYAIVENEVLKVTMKNI